VLRQLGSKGSSATLLITTEKILPGDYLGTSWSLGGFC
jgi:hypothetical protein